MNYCLIAMAVSLKYVETWIIVIVISTNWSILSVWKNKSPPPSLEQIENYFQRKRDCQDGFPWLNPPLSYIRYQNIILFPLMFIAAGLMIQRKWLGLPRNILNRKRLNSSILKGENIILSENVFIVYDYSPLHVPHPSGKTHPALPRTILSFAQSALDRKASTSKNIQNCLHWIDTEIKGHPQTEKRVIL